MPVQFQENGVAFNDENVDRSSTATPRRKSSFYRSPEENEMAVALKVFLFLQMSTSNGLSNFVNVYLVVIHGWSPLKAGWVRFTTDFLSLILQLFVGAILDKTKNKKIFLVVLAVSKIGSGVILMTTTNFGLLIVKGILDGIHKSAIIPVVTAMTLGAVGKVRFHRKHAAVNLMVKSVAKGLGSIILGGVAYAIYPNIKYAFSVFIATGILSGLSILTMPKESESVNPQVARGRSIILKSMPDFFKDNYSDDDVEDEPEISKPINETEPTEDPKGQRESMGRDLARKEFTENVTTTPIMTIQEMLSDPLRRKSLIFLFLVFFSFHLVNATTIPLLGQYLAIHDTDRDALPIMSGLTIIESAGAFFMTWYLKGNLRDMEYRIVLLIGCGALALRLILISVLVNFTDNLWAIGSTNLLDGIGVGCLDLMLALYSHLLSRQTGHYNLNMAVIATGIQLGESFSALLGGALATEKSYEFAFPVLAVMTVFPIAFTFGISTPSLYSQVKKDEA
eukprot:CAMPEP_0194286304 /NCGR_PEP_ID=MMETSP0169-20130528/32258_1 /TAXON_ID=218684 /ORGANISM="Corethron pennatum, Strain L29A3" /LENGTH=507 /DNA_ID=CAMNT_0039032705 /DNA_START=62 /DNA_END=1582 /DNA_ORIENTATION=+